MISFEDCVALCGLTEAEVAAIAEHEHIPDMAAAVLAQYFLNQKHQPERISRMIADDVRLATTEGNWKHAAQLLAALRHFLSAYPGSHGSAAADIARSA